ncbi:MAG: hypothetical protein A2798_01190 [Candidatus Levybacteria bacterium RIFCSPHIGHO2_01_FULL_37_17]|nr:MAG: hypothetical protein A2798_01190 [Candidatus Levybacteria bacterium RIFCSPHIGHO2_01_FULL_37_17]OGH37067.1 MAG: hypothetical protein A2959_02050 [Candidatus Levybacteria bacterium RIFCSPLOWO2_01_FULL_38_23]
MKLEQAGYPYIPGKTGINFEPLAAAQQDVIIGESGCTLRYKATTTHIGVQDAKIPGLFLVADVRNGNAIEFDLTSRLNGYRHCDLYAGKFTKFALYNFDRLGWNIRFWQSGWENGFDNYNQFMQGLERGLGIVDAAKNTWTGRIATSYGFELRRDSIVIDDDMVKLVFHR